MTSRVGVHTWRRLLLAVCLVAAPLVAAVTVDVAGAHPSGVVHVQSSPNRTSDATAKSVANAGHGPFRHLSGSIPVGILAAGVTIGWFALAGLRRRAAAASAMGQRAHRARAPPKEASSLVPSGLASGSAGRLPRSPRAQSLHRSSLAGC